MKYIDKDGTIKLQGDGDLVISSHRFEYSFSIDRDSEARKVEITGFNFAKCGGRFRIARMWKLAKLVWPYTA